MTSSYKNPANYGLITNEVIVYILTDNFKGPDAVNTASIFSNPFFKIRPANIILSDSKLSYRRKLAMRVLRALADASQNFHSYACVIVKDSSICYHTPAVLANTIQSIVKDDDYHLCYLAKWLDDCKSYTSMKELLPGIATVRTSSPNGLQAICFSPHGREVTLGAVASPRGRTLNFSKSEDLSLDLNRAIFSGDLSAITAARSMIYVDPMKINGRWFKYNECFDATGLLGTVGVGANIVGYRDVSGLPETRTGVEPPSVQAPAAQTPTTPAAMPTAMPAVIPPIPTPVPTSALTPAQYPSVQPGERTITIPYNTNTILLLALVILFLIWILKSK